jgi:hypothetical protein
VIATSATRDDLKTTNLLAFYKQSLES